MIKLRALGKIFKNTFKQWNEDDPFRQSAIIAYYAIFSFPALLMLVINIAGFFFGREAVNGEISYQISKALGDETAEQIEEIIVRAGETQNSIIPFIIGLITILFGATGVFVQLQKSLNMVWEVRQRPDLGIRKVLLDRLFSFGLIFSIGFLLLVSLVITSILNAVSDWLREIFPDFIAVLFQVLDIAISLSVISVLFALVFKFLPDVKIKWKHVWRGALLTAVLFTIGKYALGFYFGKAEPGSVYGAAGSVVLIMLWVSYSSMIVFFGAEFTKQYMEYYGTYIEPNSKAERIPHPQRNLTREERYKTATA